MSGPAGPTRGPRFSGGYQFPRTHSAQLSRGEPIRVERLAPEAYAQIVPLAGSATGRLFDVYGSWVKRGPDGPITVTSSTIAHDELEARIEWQRLVSTIRRELAA